MDISDFETELVELAGRHVRTPEGAKKYGLPIGALITADAVATAKAKGLGPVPEDAGYPGSPKSGGTPPAAPGKAAPGTIAAQAEAAKATPPKPPTAPATTKLNLKVQKPSISGNKHFTVGDSKYTAPNNSKLITPIGQEGLAYVVTPDGKTHAFNADGEIVIPDTLQTIFDTKFSGDLMGDTKYEESDFDATSASFKIEDLPIGAVLNDKEGTPQFKKTGKTDWEQTTLGVKLDEKDIKPLYDDGDLLPAETADTKAAASTFDDSPATDFSGMSTADVQAALDKYETGQKLTMGAKDPVTVTKNADGTWTSDFAPTSPIASSSLALAKNVLKVGQDEKQANPLEGNPLDPTDKPSLHKGDVPNAEWIDTAPTDAEMTFKSPGGGTTVWTKQEDKSWLNQNGGKMSANGMTDSLKYADKNLKITNEGGDTTPSGLNKNGLSPQLRKKVEEDQAAGLHDKKPLPQIKERTKAAPKEPTPRSSSSLTPGEGDYTEKASGSDVENSEVGDTVLVSFDGGNMVSEYQLNTNGAWDNVDDPTESLGYVTMKAMANDDGSDQVYKHQSNSVTAGEPAVSSEIPGTGDYETSAAPDEINTAGVGDKFLLDAFAGPREYALESNDLWVNTDNEGDVVSDAALKNAAVGGKLYANVNNSNFDSKSEGSPKAEREPKAVVNSTDLAWSEDMKPLDIALPEDPNYINPGDGDYAAETTPADITDAQPGDKILIGHDPDYDAAVGGSPHFEAFDLVEKQPDGSWKSLSSKSEYDENALDEWVSPAPGEQDDAQQLFTFKGNSTKGVSDSKSGVSQKEQGVGNGTGNESASGNSVSEGSGGVAEKSQPGLGKLDGSGNPDGNGVGVELADGSKPQLLNDGKTLEHDERTQALKDKGIPVSDLYELDSSKSSKAFQAAISKLKENNPYHASVYVYPEDEYSKMRLFLNSDGTAGVALKGDEIVSVFVQPGSKDKGSGQSLISQAVAQGGKRLDAYDTVLPKIYAKEGFVAVARTPWNDTYAPDGWDKKTYSKFNGGEPDVVFMKYEPDSLDGDYYTTDGVVVSDYDEGVALAKGESIGGGLPDGIPAGSTPLDKTSLGDIPEGTHIFEMHTSFQKPIEYEKTSDGEYSWNAILPSGLSAPLKQSYLEGTVGDLYQAPSSDGAKAPKLSPTEYLDANGSVTKKVFKPYPGAGTGSSIDSFNGLNTGDVVTVSIFAKGGSGVGTDQKTYKLNEQGTWDNLNQPWVEPLKTGALQYQVQQAKSFGKITLDNEVGSPSDSKFKVGDTIKGVEDLDAQVANTTLTYTKKDGSESKYVKLENGSWLTPGGGVMASIQLKGSANSGKFKVNSLPETSAPSVPTGPYVSGEAVKKYGHLRDMPEGTVLTENSVGGNFLLDMEKKNDGWWSIPNAKFSKSMKISPDELANDILSGSLVYKSGPQSETVPSTVLDTQLYPGGPAMSKTSIQEAYTALNEHSSFQVAYGLKALDSSHPLASKDAQEALKIAALNKYPELKTKPAVVKFLGDELGISTIKDPEFISDDSPQIWLGSKNPVEGVQGFDGGNFTTTEIQEAVDILENYPGKLFKSELGKKGSPLGKLNPNELVGFDKDKLASKQKFIDLLKTKLTTNEELTSHPMVTSDADLKKLAVGTKLRFHGHSEHFTYYTKTSDNQWLAEDEFTDGKAKPSFVTDSNFSVAIAGNKISIESIPENVPDYVKTPAAVSSKHVDEIDVENFTSDSVSSAPVGTELTNKKDPIYSAHKLGGDSWEVINTETGQPVSLMTEKSVKGWLDSGTWELKQQDGPSMNTENGGLTPGKYISGGKAYMIVDADGTGVYVNTKGDVQKLTSKAVKSNYDKGMNKYQGIPDSVPTPTIKTAQKDKPAVVGDLADGTYFAGNPADPKSVVYEVSGDSAKVFKPATITGFKVGGSPNSHWAEEASTGASFEYPSHYNYATSSSVSSANWTKGDDGLWHSDVADMEPASYAELIDNMSVWGMKIKSHGLSKEPVVISKKKVNTLFAQGKFLDSEGNSIVPEGYSGAVYFWGHQTTIPAMLDAQKVLETADFGTGKEFENAMHAAGIYYDGKLVRAYTVKNFGEISLDNYVASFKKNIADMTSGLDTDIPENDASKIFEWNSLGEAKMPLELSAKDIDIYDAKSTTAYIKEASKFFGGGIIGQHVAKMPTYDRTQWIIAFRDGNFEKMYNLEVSAAAEEKKAHNSGYLHPGFATNTETHKIAWAAAVDGEISALTDVPGNWSSTGISPSAKELDNYLISAQMQNPTYLSLPEKRNWVTFHRKGEKSSVDQLSATAALRKKNGAEELTEAPVWTDDLKPTKSYEILFESTDLPNTGWSRDAANDYVADNPDNQELQAAVATANENYGSYDGAKYGVIAYFNQKKVEYDEAAKQIHYVKTPTQTVEKGTHPIFEYDDFNGHGPLGNHYFFKPSPQGDNYRSEAEHLGHEFGWKFGFSTADSKLVELDGKYGQLQKDLGGVTDLSGYDFSTLTPSQIADIGREHILDWFLDNDDTHSANMKILTNGQVVGIDKGRAFKHYGHWNGLSPDGMNTNTQTVYSKMFDAIQSGKLSKADVDEAYVAIQRRAQQMSKVSDSKIAEMLAEGMKNRSVWDISYSIDGKKVPNNLDGLTAAVNDRKSKLPEQIEAMWQKLYTSAGWSDLPKPPPAALGEGHYAGLGESHFHQAAFKVNAGGVSALIGGNYSTTGSAIAWGTTNKNGTKDMFTQMELDHIADADVYSKLQAMAPDAPQSATANHSTFSADEYGAFYSRDYYRAMATIVKHNDDKEYNSDRISDYETAKIRMQKDWDHWSPALVGDENELVKFPSGAAVPVTQLGQYRQMMEFYRGHEAELDASIATKVEFPVASKTKFEAYQLAPKAKHFSNGSESLVELPSGEWLHSTPGGVSTISGEQQKELISHAIWSEMAPPPEGPKNYGGAIVSLQDKPFETKGKMDTETGVISTGTASVGGWTSGREYAVELPTGEKIYFRNRGKTNTLKSQSGRLTIHVPKAASSEDYAAGLERAQAWMESYMGLDRGDVDDESAELIYWKQMLPILTRRNHTVGTKYQAAFGSIEKKATELNTNTDEFGIHFGATASVAEQNEFYRKVWGDQFGKDKIDKLLTDKAYLPEYEGTDIHNPDVVQGRPVWNRFDYTLADLLTSTKGKNVFVASGSHSGDKTDRVSAVAESGSHLSTEERIRFFGGIDGGSSSADQMEGTGGQDQFTRIWNDPNLQGYDFVFHPSVLLRTNTRFFANDAFGSESSERDFANPDAKAVWSHKHGNSAGLGGGNQLDIRWASSWLKSLEMTVFDDIHARDAAIQKLKKAGLAMIRGLPVEDRLVMRKDREAAIEKLREHWQKEAGI